MPKYSLPFDEENTSYFAHTSTVPSSKCLECNDGAHLLVSSAAWAPGLHGPNGEWERCTYDTGLPLFVCNRTGVDRTLDFTGAESVIVKDGHRLLSLQAKQSTIFLIEWNQQTHTLASRKYTRVTL